MNTFIIETLVPHIWKQHNVEPTKAKIVNNHIEVFMYGDSGMYSEMLPEIKVCYPLTQTWEKDTEEASKAFVNPYLHIFK